MNGQNVTGRGASRARASLAFVGVLLAACSQGAPTGVATVSATTAVLQPSAPLTTPLHTAAGGATPLPTASTGTGAAGSLVYIAGNNIWLAAPDGSGARQLTADGVQGNAYHAPAQSDDGRIFALRGSRMFIQLDRQGRPLAEPVRLITLENGAEALAVAPDGTRVAYVTTGYGREIDPRFGTPSGTFLYGGMDVATLDGTSIEGAAASSLLYPDWVDNGQIVGADGVDLFVDDAGQSEPQRWVSYDDGCLIAFDCPAGKEAAASLSTPVVSGNGRVLAYSYKPYFGPAGRRMASLGAAPPALPSTRCVVPGQENYADPGTFAQDGSVFAYDDTNYMPETFEVVVGAGIHVFAVDLDTPDCGASSARLVIPGGSQPEWGQASP